MAAVSVPSLFLNFECKRPYKLNTYRRSNSLYEAFLATKHSFFTLKSKKRMNYTTGISNIAYFLQTQHSNDQWRVGTLCMCRKVKKKNCVSTIDVIAINRKNFVWMKHEKSIKIKKIDLNQKNLI
jgi:hypothetical protein